MTRTKVAISLPTEKRLIEAMDGRQTRTATGKTRNLRPASLTFPPEINNSAATTHTSSTRPYRLSRQGVGATLRRDCLVVSSSRGLGDEARKHAVDAVPDRASLATSWHSMLVTHAAASTYRLDTDPSCVARPSTWLW